MNPSLSDVHAPTVRAPHQPLGYGRSIEDELAVITEELAAARELFVTCDPDSPPWSAEAELRRLELRWTVLTADGARPSSPGRAYGFSGQQATANGAAIEGRARRRHPVIGHRAD